MFLDFHRTSIGQYAIFATVRGSYGEQIHTQVGRNYPKAVSAAKAAIRMAADTASYRDVTVKCLKTKVHTYIDPIAAKAYLKEQQ